MGICPVDSVQISAPTLIERFFYFLRVSRSEPEGGSDPQPYKMTYGAGSSLTDSAGQLLGLVPLRLIVSLGHTQPVHLTEHPESQI